MPPIYTKTGDCGKTSLIGGTRIPKSDPRLEAYGTLDELTAFEGELFNRLEKGSTAGEYLLWVMDRTMDCAAITASDGTSSKLLPQITSGTIARTEEMIDTLLKNVPQVDRFTLPAGSPALSMSHVCRTVCRRAERRLVSLQDTGASVDSNVICFINRLSDFFYALGRHTVMSGNVEEIYWEASRDNM